MILGNTNDLFPSLPKINSDSKNSPFDFESIFNKNLLSSGFLGNTGVNHNIFNNTGFPSINTGFSGFGFSSINESTNRPNFGMFSSTIPSIFGK